MISIEATHDLRDKEPIATNEQIQELIHISESPKSFIPWHKHWPRFIVLYRGTLVISEVLGQKHHAGGRGLSANGKLCGDFDYWATQSELSYKKQNVCSESIAAMQYTLLGRNN